MAQRQSSPWNLARASKTFFDVSTRGNDLQFDYRLHAGTAGTSTAVALLEVLGYPRGIIEGARRRCAGSERDRQPGCQ
jgi:DNA mismatch repair ATPase MutS